MSTNEQLDKLNDKIIKLAIDSIDVEALAQELSEYITKETSDSLKKAFEDSSVFQDWLMDELTNYATPSGKAMQKGIAKIATRMVKAV